MNRQSGVTLVELMAVVAILAIGLGISALYLRPMEAPLQTTGDLLEGTFRSARLKAMATTSAYRLRPLGTDSVIAEYANHCAASTWTRDERLDLEFPEDVSLASTAWAVCFASRGTSSGNVVVQLVHPEFGTRGVEVLLGGTTRILP